MAGHKAACKVWQGVKGTAGKVRGSNPKQGNGAHKVQSVMGSGTGRWGTWEGPWQAGKVAGKVGWHRG